MQKTSCRVTSSASQIAMCCHGPALEGHLTHSPTHPTLSEEAKPLKPTSFRVSNLNSVRSISVNNTHSFMSYVFVSEQILQACG